MIQDQGRVPAKGWHKDVPFPTYLGWDCVNASLLKLIRRSPAHAKWARENQREETDAFRAGRAFHSVTLEPERFAMEFAKAPQVDRRTTAGKMAWDHFVSRHANQTPLKPDEYEMVMRMHDSVLAHPKARELLSAKGQPELSLCWAEKGVGLWCKARMDFVLDGSPTIVDLKSTDDASPEGFARSLLRFGYHVQDAFYRRGHEAETGKWPSFIFVAAEKEPPYGVACYQIPDDTIRRVADEVDGSLHRLRACMETGEWPAYSDQIQELVLPAWVG